MVLKTPWHRKHFSSQTAPYETYRHMYYQVKNDINNHTFLDIPTPEILRIKCRLSQHRNITSIWKFVFVNILEWETATKFWRTLNCSCQYILALLLKICFLSYWNALSMTKHVLYLLQCFRSVVTSLVTGIVIGSDNPLLPHGYHVIIPTEADFHWWELQ